MKRLKNSIVEHADTNLYPQSFEELFSIMKKLRKSSKTNSKWSVRNIIQIEKIMELSKITYKMKIYTTAERNRVFVQVAILYTSATISCSTKCNHDSRFHI